MLITRRQAFGDILSSSHVTRAFHHGLQQFPSASEHVRENVTMAPLDVPM